MEYSIANISPNVVQLLLNLYGSNENDLLKIISSSPKTSVLRVNSCHQNADEALCLLNTYLEKSCPGKRFNVSHHGVINDILLVNPIDDDGHQTCYEKEVIVDTNCGSAVLRGADIFAPGVLAASPAMKKGDMVSVFVDLEKKCRKGLIKQFEGKKYFLGNGIALYSRNELFENNSSLRGTAIEMTQCRNQHPSFTNLDLSIFFPQNLPSILVGHILNPKEGDVVLDMCASPGGKTTHVATLLRNKGNVIAIDKTQKKVDRIVTNCSNLGLTNVKTFAYDSTKLLSEMTEHESSPSTGPPFLRESFDQIILDPPCSGLGQRPQLYYVMKDKELHSYPIYQKRLLKQAVQLLKRGGTLLYSTCTLLPQENEEQVAWVLKNYPEMKLNPQTPFLGRPGLHDHGLTSTECENVQRFDCVYRSYQQHDVPMETDSETEEVINQSCNNDTIGFFIAKFTKI